MGFKLGDIVHDARTARRRSDADAPPDTARAADERATFDADEPHPAEPQAEPRAD